MAPPDLAPAAMGHADSFAIDVADLRVDLADRRTYVVADVGFQLCEGEILGLVGESGSGKTTTALALLGYARAGTVISSGSVIVGGLNLLSLSSPDLRRQRGALISYVPQDPAASLNPGIRIETQLSEILETHGHRADSRDRVSEMLTEVKLPNDASFLRRYPHELSGGQQQRVALAMAFACRPQVVVLDEPTTGLDVTTQAHVLRTVRELCDEHRTAAIYVSHDLAVVGELAHRIAVMYLGRLVELGPRDALMRRAAHPYTRRLINAIPDPRRRLALVGIPGRVEPLTRRPAGCVFVARCDFAEPACASNQIGIAPVESGHEVACRRWQYVQSQANDNPRESLRPALPTADGTASLTVKALVARYGTNEVLHGVDLSISRGGCVALVGESGSGKTTLARCIAGLHAQASGAIRLGEDPLAFGSRARSAEARRGVQYVFQNPFGSLNPRKTVRQLIEQPLRLFWGRPGTSDERVASLLEQVALNTALGDRYPAQLSGGERQRVAIARALAADPELLICDEITSALDVSVQASILNLLARLRIEREVSILFVTHNLSIVRAVAQRVVVLNRGNIVEEGDVDQVLDEPAGAYTRQLLSDTPSIVSTTLELPTG